MAASVFKACTTRHPELVRIRIDDPNRRRAQSQRGATCACATHHRASLPKRLSDAEAVARRTRGSRGSVARLMIRRDDEVDARVQVIGDLRIDNIGLVADHQRLYELHTESLWPTLEAAQAPLDLVGQRWKRLPRPPRTRRPRTPLPAAHGPQFRPAGHPCHEADERRCADGRRRRANQPQARAELRRRPVQCGSTLRQYVLDLMRSGRGRSPAGCAPTGPGLSVLGRRLLA